MNDTPHHDTPHMDEAHARERDQRIRERAYTMWEAEGCPEGCADAHWDKATELVAIEEGLRTTLQPLPELGPYGEPVEQSRPASHGGEIPTLTDQGEQKYPPGS
jgi:hypothetical protein